MNKKIKVIDLLNKIAKAEELPQKILIKDIVWYLVKDDDGDFTYSKTQDNDWQKYIDYQMALTRHLNEEVLILDDEVEILEDNTEEIEEYKGQSFEQLGYEVGKMTMAIAKGLEKAIKEMRKEKGGNINE